MKQLTTVLAFFVFMVFTASACNNGDNGKTSRSVQEKTVVASGHESNPASSAGDPSEDGDDGKPVFLDVDTFKEKVWNYEENPDKWVYEGDKPAIIDFYADWCKPCKMVAPILEEIAEEYKGELVVYKINTQYQRELAAVFQVQSIPTFLYIPVDGKPQMDRGYKDKTVFERIVKEFLLKK